MEKHDDNQVKPDRGVSKRNGFVTHHAGVLAPVVEEIIFRGIYQKPLKASEGWGYISDSSCAFHGANQLSSFVIYAVSSVIFTLLAYRNPSPKPYCSST